MRIGFNNACFPQWDVETTFAWAVAHGWPTIELHGGPRYTYIDWEAIAEGRNNPVADAQSRTGVSVAGIMHGMLPFLSPEPDVRARAVIELDVLLRAAARCEIPLVSTFTGRDPAKTIDENIEGFAKVFPAIAELAHERGVRLAFENCPMYEFWPNDANIAVAPSIWREMFELVPNGVLGINLDPSHLVWQGIDISRAVKEFAERLWLVQAKDTERLPWIQSDQGMLTLRWWRHRLPGQGELDWVGFLSALEEVGYGGPIIVEHEDPLWLGDEDRVSAGLLLARDFLERVWGPSERAESTRGRR
jgi:sugar phosphate isomerase/epimerase